MERFHPMTNQYQLPKLPYDFDALEPVISAKIMELHYTKHHQTYVNNLNKALEDYELAEKNNNVAEMIALQSKIKFNGGGHVNHSIFWTNLAPQKSGGGQLKEGKLKEAIEKKFHSVDKFKEKFNAATAAVQGSGWGWLGYNKETGCLEIATCCNQDPLSTKGLVPLLGVDVWEHAYYLQYASARADYLKNIWNVVNWENVEQRFLEASKQ